MSSTFNLKSESNRAQDDHDCRKATSIDAYADDGACKRRMSAVTNGRFYGTLSIVARKTRHAIRFKTDCSNSQRSVALIRCKK